ncbi:MAG: anaerobic ribonucleoside-triphosphate reductase [Oscillospiraceae bacterium]
MNIDVKGGEITPREQQAYVDYVLNKHPHSKLEQLDINIDGDYAELKYKFESQPFERIRRITGYLVGTLDRWNDAKKAEEHDRLKHTL